MSTFDTWMAFSNFSSSVQFKNRYIIDPESQEFLDTLYQTAKQRIEILPKEGKLYRSQMGNDSRKSAIDENDFYLYPVPFRKERMLPRRNITKEGRANPKGISVVYASNDVDTALSESKPWLGSLISLATLNIRRELRVINFRTAEPFSKIFLNEPNDETKIEKVWSDIDRAFSQPVATSDDRADYTATQVISEYFRSKGFDGIAYRSALGKGYNFALFDLESINVLKCALYVSDDVTYSFSRNST